MRVEQSLAPVEELAGEELIASDDYVNAIRESLPDDMQASVHEEEVLAVLRAVYDYKRSHRKRHWLDWRLKLPLFFTRAYLVLLMGKDTRQTEENSLVQRRTAARHFMRGADTLAGVAFSLFVLILLGAAIGFVIYLLKRSMGIDFDPYWSAVD